MKTIAATSTALAMSLALSSGAWAGDNEDIMDVLEVQEDIRCRQL